MFCTYLHEFMNVYCEAFRTIPSLPGGFLVSLRLSWSSALHQELIFMTGSEVLRFRSLLLRRGWGGGWGCHFRSSLECIIAKLWFSFSRISRTNLYVIALWYSDIFHCVPGWTVCLQWGWQGFGKPSTGVWTSRGPFQGHLHSTRLISGRDFGDHFVRPHRPGAVRPK